MQNESENNLIYTKSITEFITISAEYCLFVENTLTFSKYEFLDKSRKLLSLLYLKGSLLPKFEYEYNEDIEKFVTEEDWSFINESISKKLDQYNDYKDIVQSDTTGKYEVVLSSIGENLADVYQDIKNFVSLFNMGTEDIMKDAIGECQLNFEEFWGQKALNGLKAIHRVLLNPEISEENEKGGTDDPDNFEERNTSDWFITKRQSDLNNTD